MATEERFERIETNLEKHTLAIGDLIVISWTLVNTAGEIQQAQKHTDEKLNALIETVDRVVRSWQKPNGNQ